MKTVSSIVAGPMTARQELEGFIAKYSPEIGALGRTAIRKMRTLFRSANLLVYDNYNALAVGFAPDDRASHAIFSIALFPRWVSLFFLQNGTKLHDPKRLLQGSGKRARHLVLESAAMLDKPDVRALLRQACREAAVPFEQQNRGRIIIKSVSPTQRPRRPKANSR